MQRIPLRTIVDIEGRPVQIPERDATGEIVYVDTCPICENPAPDTVLKQEDATVLRVVRSIIWSIPPTIHRRIDSQIGYRIMNALVAAERRVARGKPNVTINIEEGDHAWMLSLLDRKLPKPADIDDPEYEQRTFCDGMFGMNSWAVVQQLTPKGLPDVEDEDDDGTQGVEQSNGNPKVQQPV